MKSIKRFLLGIALILVAIWGVLSVLLLYSQALLVVSFLILAAGVVFVFLGFFTGENRQDDNGFPPKY